MKYDIIGIGSPLIDLTIQTTDEELKKIDIKKGGMHLVSSEKISLIMSKMGKKIMKTSPGDSSANTIVAISNFGLKCAYIGKVGSDEHGDFFIGNIIKNKVESKIIKSNFQTGKVIALITPDAQRTMIVFLGAAENLTEKDVIENDIVESQYLHLTGYQLEIENLRNSSLKAMRIAKREGNKISIDLADPFLVERNRDFLKDIVKEFAHVVFANEEEAKAFTQEANPEKACSIISKLAPVAVVKMGERGSIIKSGEKKHFINAYKVKAVDTTGAGDIYAGGVLFGMINNYSFEKAGKIGSYAASKVVSQMGARLEYSITDDFDDL